ncbi:restriction endonuclease subunit S [Granulosicoccus antarcticus]|uniref:Type I restriction modification DNA specificity domain-containing protein n=1 Tax=Granulosicoccus antarcticus IMCC3135 TaxID=1192854 RepID=A0A2Z2NNL2_9GAMM|nr:restriction endonuclease subunit S [Granulosicoccus antarcticus]ASJ72809.1 hypothetical protein IMCC3135_13620 [Granulosicoccus antarcticus IMCC3135]
MAKVSDIATLRNGFAFRGRIEHDETGDTRVIQASDLTQNAELQTGTLTCVQLGKQVPRYHVNEHDVVFMARGQRQLAYRPILQTVTGKPIITTFGLLVITADPQQTTADYLHWALNTPQVQQRLHALKEGTGIAFISENNLGSVDIPLPTLDVQTKITQLVALHKQREHVRQKLATIDQKITQTTAWSLATEQST